MKLQLLSLSSFLMAAPALFAADVVTSIPMETNGMSRIREQISQVNLKVNGHHTNENVPGAVGNALRFDGYSTFVDGDVPEFNPAGASSFSVWVAPETYPIVEHDQATAEKITIAGTIDHTARTGWQFALDKNGNYSFECYSGGWLASVAASDILPTYEWSLLAAVNDPDNGTLTLYRNGEKVGQVKSLGPLGNGDSKIIIGKSKDETTGLFFIKTFNGVIDEVCVYDGALSEQELNATPENPAYLSIPESRFSNDLLRPLYHGMPGANWTNETHGMVYSGGKYHVFFQKNANGPYMSRLHWGHITSENLYDWTEEKIALAPGESYDTKGCWSGAVFTDDEITGGMPNIIYTGVDYVKAYIVQAAPTDESLLEWEKKGVIINGRPSGLSDDFRDPYFFRDGDNAYIIVGTSKNGIGATTLHKYNSASKTWSNDGSIFFAGSSKDQDGTFWEMPNITPMGNGKWLFTVTPQGTSRDVHTLVWTGEINADGTFKPDIEVPTDLELINGQGYGLLSPTIYQKDGKTLLMGIVPDKLPTSENCSLGWAHLYSLPREISLDENGKLVQKPYEGLSDLRGDKNFSAQNLTLDGNKELEGVSGRRFEAKGVFKAGSVPFGFNFFKKGDKYASLSYTPTTNRLELNLSKLNRKVNDSGSFNGVYACTLPETIEPGSDVTIDLWVDGSIVDIFVNDKWATSVRVFPTDADADGIEVFSKDGTVEAKSVQAWVLDPVNGSNGGNNGDAGVGEIFDTLPEFVDVYTLSGVLVKRNVHFSEALDGLAKGVYIVGNKKVIL